MGVGPYLSRPSQVDNCAVKAIVSFCLCPSVFLAWATQLNTRQATLWAVQLLQVTTTGDPPKADPGLKDSPAPKQPGPQRPASSLRAQAGASAAYVGQDHSPNSAPSPSAKQAQQPRSQAFPFPHPHASVFSQFAIVRWGDKSIPKPILLGSHEQSSCQGVGPHVRRGEDGGRKYQAKGLA